MSEDLRRWVVHLNEVAHKAIKDMARRRGVYMADIIEQLALEEVAREKRIAEKRLAEKVAPDRKRCRVCQGKLSPVRAFFVGDLRPLCRQCYWDKTKQLNAAQGRKVKPLIL